MKKYLYIALCCLFTACDNTENEELLESVFFGTSQEVLSQNSYTSMTPVAGIYSQEFSSQSSSKEWTMGNNEHGTFGIENDHYFIQAKGSFNQWMNFSVNETRDFQVEVSMSCNFLVGGTSLGIVFGASKDLKSYGSFMFSSEVPFFIGYYNGEKWEEWYSKSTAPYNETGYRNATHLYTIRKVGYKLHFFIDKKYLYSTDYSINLNNVGFTLSRGGVIMVDYIHVDYIETVKE